MTISIGQLIKELASIKKQKYKLSEEVEKMELKEAAIVDHIREFYNSPLTDNFEIMIVLKKPL